MKNSSHHIKVPALLRIPRNPVSRFLAKLDSQISYNFRSAGVATRPGASNGLWCCMLIPSILLFYTYICKVTKAYKIVAFVSLGMLVYSVLFSLFLYMSSLVVQRRHSAGVTVSAMVIALAVYGHLQYDLTFSLPVSIFPVLSYAYLLQTTLKKIQKTFTVGEAMVVCQGIVLCCTYFLLNTYFYVYEADSVDKEMFVVQIYIFAALSTVGLILTAIYFLEENSRDLTTLMYIILIAGLYCLTVLHSIFGVMALPKLIFLIFRDAVRIKLFCSWLALVAVTVLVLAAQTLSGSRASSSTRKIFHLLATIVFLTGIVIDPEFMVLAAGIVFAILILVEGLRLSRIEPISSKLQEVFEIYCDEKRQAERFCLSVSFFLKQAFKQAKDYSIPTDKLMRDVGWFALTPIYLYLGVGCPGALVPWRHGAQLEMLSGCLAIGVGDAAASFVGERHGRTKWPDSNRSLEGTISSIISQIVVVYLLDMFHILPGQWSVFRAALAATVNSLVEARTDQVDNLILPLVTILALQPTATFDTSS